MCCKLDKYPSGTGSRYSDLGAYSWDTVKERVKRAMLVEFGSFLEGNGLLCYDDTAAYHRWSPATCCGNSEHHKRSFCYFFGSRDY
jgi:hypothetical protein